MNNQVNERFRSVAGEIAWGMAGTGPDVVLVHGTPANSVIWNGVIERLQDSYRFYYLDLPGYGGSEKFDGQDVRLRSFARTLREFLEYCGIDRPHLVGHDFGASTVMGAHLMEEVNVASLVVADGVLLNPWGTPFSLHIRQYEKVFAVLPDYIHRAILAAHLATSVARPLPPEIEAALLEPWTGNIGQPAYYRQKAQFDHEYTSWLEELYPSIEVPVTVLWGEHDRWIIPDEGRRFCSMVAGAELRMLPDAGHFSMVDTPGLFARELDAALRQGRI